jgi:hypothetical protein
VIDSDTLLASSGSDILQEAILSAPCLSGVPLELPIRPERIGPCLRSNPSDKHRPENQTNGDSRFGRNPIPKSGGQDYRASKQRNACVNRLKDEASGRTRCERLMKKMMPMKMDEIKPAKKAMKRQ